MTLECELFNIVESVYLLAKCWISIPLYNLSLSSLGKLGDMGRMLLSADCNLCITVQSMIYNRIVDRSYEGYILHADFVVDFYNLRKISLHADRLVKSTYISRS